MVVETQWLVLVDPEELVLEEHQILQGEREVMQDLMVQVVAEAQVLQVMVLPVLTQLVEQGVRVTQMG
jgi:hypothetical protein